MNLRLSFDQVCSATDSTQQTQPSCIGLITHRPQLHLTYYTNRQRTQVLAKQLLALLRLMNGAYHQATYLHI